MTYTTRYNRDYWVTLDGLEKHYERAEVDARRSDDRAQYDITTKNLTRLVLRADRPRHRHQHRRPEAARQGPRPRWPLREIEWDLETGERSARKASGRSTGCRVRSTMRSWSRFWSFVPPGTPWNAAANDQALRMLQRFDRQYALAYRGHIRVKDDKDVTAADFAKYHVVLFGDPGSNRWIAKLNGKLPPLHWTKETVALGSQSFPRLSRCRR